MQKSKAKVKAKNSGWKKKKLLREKLAQKTIDFFDNNPYLDLTATEANNIINQSEVSLHTFRNILSNLTTKKPCHLVAERTCRIINKKSCTVTVFKKNHDSNE